MTFRGIAALALGGALLAGCGTTGSGTVQVRYSTTTPAAVADVAGFSWSVRREPRSLDWIRGGDTPEDTITANLCERLVRLNEDGVPEPGLAISTTSPDQRTWTYTLRKGVRFHDGRVLSAADVVASLRRTADPALGGNQAHLLDKVDSVRATGPLRVTIELREPDPLFNHVLAGNAGVVASAKYLADNVTDYGTPSTSDGCTGPFRLSAWVPGSHILLARFDEYWNPAGRARASGVQFTFADGPALVNALLNGTVDGAYLPSPTGTVRLNRAQAGRVYFGASNTLAALDPVPGGAFDEPRRRRALSLVLDRAAIVREAYAGLAQPTDPPAPASGEGTVLATGARPYPGLARDGLNEARALLAQAPPMTRDIVIHGADGLESAAVATAVLQACLTLGLPARIGTSSPDIMLVTGAPAPADPVWNRWIPLAQLPNTLYLNRRITGAPPSTTYLTSPWAARVGRSGR